MTVNLDFKVTGCAQLTRDLFAIAKFLLHLYQIGVALNSALKTVYHRFFAVFAFETDDCGRLLG